VENCKICGWLVNSSDTIPFYENGKIDYPFETVEFTYRFIASDSLIVYNHGFENITRYSNYPKTAL